MAKKIRFPLELADGTQARTLEDLQEHFDLESVLSYYKNGKLLTWLRDRYLESEAEAVEALDETAADFLKQFCGIFGAEYKDHSVDLEEIARRQERLAKLRTYTDEVEFIDHIDLVAFDQEDLADLLDDGQKEIYLCGDRFDIPVSQHGVHYKGITNPVLHLTGKLPEDMEETGITFENCAVENMPETAPDTVEQYFHKCFEKSGSKESLNFSIVVLSSEQDSADVTGNISGAPNQLLEQLKETIQAYIFSSNKQIEEFQLRLKNDIGQEFPKQLQSFRLHVSQPVEATVSKIAIAPGKKGYRTIQVQFEHPVFLDGVRYDHVPVLSLNLFEQMNLRVGSTVSVHRVGDVIPSIKVIKEGKGEKIEAPHDCPDCGEPFTIKNKKLYCEDLLCPGNIVGRFTGFFEKIGLDGYGESFAELLINQLGCKTLADVIHLTKESMMEAGIESELMLKFPKRLKEAIQSKHDYEIIAAMGIPDVGPAKAKILLKKYPFEKLTEFALLPDKVYDMAGTVFAKVSDNLAFTLSDKWFNDEIKAFLEIGFIVTDNFDRTKVGHTGGALSDHAIELCEKLDYEIVDDKSFDILITSSMESTSGKMERAKKMGLPIYTEDSFIEQYGNN